MSTSSFLHGAQGLATLLKDMSSPRTQGSKTTTISAKILHRVSESWWVRQIKIGLPMTTDSFQYQCTRKKVNDLNNPYMVREWPGNGIFINSQKFSKYVRIFFRDYIKKNLNGIVAYWGIFLRRKYDIYSY